MYNFTLSFTLLCFVARHLLSRIYALSSVKFLGPKLRLCKKKDKYEVWDLPAGDWRRSQKVESWKIKNIFHISLEAENVLQKTEEEKNYNSTIFLFHWQPKIVLGVNTLYSDLLRHSAWLMSQTTIAGWGVDHLWSA